MTTHYTNLEVTLNGLTFIVSGTYTPSEPATEHCPYEPEEFHISPSRTRVKGQPEADPDTILEEFRDHHRIELRSGAPFSATTAHFVNWDSGHEQLVKACLRVVSEKK